MLILAQATCVLQGCLLTGDKAAHFYPDCLLQSVAPFLEMGKVGLGSPSWLEHFPEAASDQEGLVRMV